MSGDPTNDARILAALRALPPETVADVRGYAESALWVAGVLGLDSATATNCRNEAARLTAVADLLDAAREAPRG